MREQGSVLVVGLGDLGIRIVNMLARSSRVGLLVAAGRQHESGEALASQARLIATLGDGPENIRFEAMDVAEPEKTAATLRRIGPDILVMSASRLTWWRPLSPDPRRSEQLAELPYGAWLPVHVAMVRQVMQAVHQAGTETRVLSLPFPDAVGPALAPSGLAPDIGAGNVSEAAAKLKVLTARRYRVPRKEVDVRLVMHHGAEREVFAAFASLAGREQLPGHPPWLATVHVSGRALSKEEIAETLRAPYPLPAARESQTLTAAAAVQLVDALLDDIPHAVHAPAPFGLPGGYPILASREHIELDLPAEISVTEARAVNEAAARWDGIEDIGEDGTIVFTAEVSAAAERTLGLRLDRVRPTDIEAVADELLERAESWRSPP